VQEGDDTLAARDSAPRTGEETVDARGSLDVAVSAAVAGARGGSRRVGDLVGRYVLLERIGAGGMGVVHRAYDPELDRHVALKLLRAGARGDTSDSARLRLLREAQALAKLSHPNVVAVYDVGTTGEDVFLAMALVEGVDLSTRLRGKGRLPWREAVRILAAAGSGLAAAHELGLVHRDFKPANVLLASDGGVVVTDFGLARVDDLQRSDAPPATSSSSWLEVELTMEGTLMGTPSYMAPEQHLSAPADARSDQYSFATTLWECIYGARPFPRMAPDDLGMRKAKGAPPCPAEPGIPGWLRQVLQRGLAAEPGQRFADMRALLAALDEGPRRQRRRMAGVALAAATAGVGLLVVSADPPRDPCPVDVGEAVGAPDRWRTQRDEIAAVMPASGIAARIDGMLARRSASLREACRATFVLGQRPQSWWIGRERCATRQAVVLDAALARSIAESRVRARIDGALDAIPAADDCDPDVEDPDLSTLARLAEVEVLLGAGVVAAALVELESFAGDLVGVAAIEADVLRARASAILGDREGAESRLLAAVARARGEGFARLETRLWIEIADVALAGGRSERAAFVIDLAVAARPADGRADDDALAGALALVQARLARAQADPSACERFGTALEALERAHGAEHGLVQRADVERDHVCALPRAGADPGTAADGSTPPQPAAPP